MSLNKTVIPVLFSGGADTRTAEKLVQNGFFPDLQNVVRRKTGQLAKRYGFSAYGKDIFGSSSITSGQRLATFRNDLLLVSDSNIYSYSTARNAWSQRGQVITATVASTPVIRTSEKQAMPDMVSYKGITVSVWEDSRGGVRCTVTDDSTDAPIMADQVVSSSGSRPKVIGVSDTFIIGYYEAGDLKCKRISITDPTTLTSATILETSMEDEPWDLAVYDRVGVYVVNVSTAMQVGYVTAAGIAGSPGVNGYPSSVTTSYQGSDCVTIVPDVDNQLIYLVYHDTAGVHADELVCDAYTSDLNSVTTGTVEAVTDITNVTAVLQSDSTLTVFYEKTAAAAKDYHVRKNTVTYSVGTFTMGTPAVFARSVGLAGKAFIADENTYVTVVHESTLQSTYFTIKQDGFIVTKMQPSFASGLTRNTGGSLKSGLPRVSEDQDGDFVFPVCVKNKLLTETSAIQSSFVGINKQTLTFGSSTYNTDTLGENLHIAGGVVQIYDGVSPVEHGFHLYPEDISASSALTAGSVTGGDYLIVALYEWVDGQGQIHRSAGSVEYLLTSATASKTIDVVVPTLRLTSKTGTRANARVVVYRSLAGQTTVLYRDNDIANDPTTDSVTVTLTQSDGDLQTQEILYTVGGELDNTPALACTALHKHKGRLFQFGLEDQYAVSYSKQHIFGEGVGFSDGFTRRVDPRGGPVRCGSSLDDKLVIFKDTAIAYQVGDGPLATGAQDDYGDPQFISTDVGCNNPRSIIIVPQGVMFQSQKGIIYLLDRSLNTVPIGMPMDAYKDLTITSAVLNETDDEVRFTTSTGVCLVYNYTYNQWSTFSNYTAADATTFLNKYVHLKSDGTVNQEVVGQYHDNGQTYSRRIEFNWFNLGRYQGFQRIYKWSLLGDFLTHCIARISVAYDYEPVYSQVAYFNTQTGLGTSTFGSDETFGSGEVFGSTDSNVFQVRSKPRRQKCQSIKLLVEDLDTITTSGGGCFDLVSLEFEVGQKTGLYRGSYKKSTGG
jgi:hypothetical protein